METSSRYCPRLNDFRVRIRAEKPLSTYTILEEEYGVNRYYLWHIINTDNYDPPDRIKEKLGIQIFKPAPICLKCGNVHVTKKCMANNGNGHRPRRVAIRIDNPESAARTIEKHFGKAFVSELIELL